MRAPRHSRNVLRTEASLSKTRVNGGRGAKLAVSGGGINQQNTKTHVNGRKPTKEDENAKLLVPRGLREEGPSSLGFLEMREKNPCLPAKVPHNSLLGRCAARHVCREAPRSARALR